MAQSTQDRTLTVSCVFCEWTQTGRPNEMLEAQREHRREHAQNDESRRPL